MTGTTLTHQEDRKQQQATSGEAAADVAFFPLTMPFTTGPGTISVAIALRAASPSNPQDLLPFLIGCCLAALAIALIVGISYASADRVVALLGQARSRVVTRLAAFILLCVGIQILLTGLQDFLVPLFASRA